MWVFGARIWHRSIFSCFVHQVVLIFLKGLVWDRSKTKSCTNYLKLLSKTIILTLCSNVWILLTLRKKSADDILIFVFYFSPRK